MTTLSGLASSLLGLVVFLAVVWVALRVAQNIFGTDTKKGAATEVAAKLVAYPTGSKAVLRRRFVRALTSQNVIMPSGERHAYSELTVRVAPEDLERLEPDGDLERLGDDAARAYLTHARREGWTTPADVTVNVEVDPGLRSGWVPPARGSGRAAESSGALGSSGLGWDVVRTGDESAAAAPRAERRQPPAPARPAPLKSVPSVPDVDLEATQGFAAIEAQEQKAEEPAPTVNVAGDLVLERDGEQVVIERDATITVVLGRLPGSPLTFTDREVSYRHAAIRLRAGKWQLKDLGSTNGTAVDGTDVEPETWVPLGSGAVIELAGVRVLAATGSAGTVALGNGHLEGLSRR